LAQRKTGDPTACLSAVVGLSESEAMSSSMPLSLEATSGTSLGLDLSGLAFCWDWYPGIKGVEE